MPPDRTEVFGVAAANEHGSASFAVTYDADRNRTRDLDAEVTRRALAGNRFRSVVEVGCGTGKNTTLRAQGRTMVFRTPIGRFRVQSKEENPKWVPPDWHYIEEAQKNGLDVVRLNRGQCVADVCASGNNVFMGGSPAAPGRRCSRAGPSTCS